MPAERCAEGRQPSPPEGPAFEGLVFDERGLIPVVVQEHSTRAVLMLAWADARALRQSLATGRATYWSRSRRQLWVKGETSGNVQEIVSVSSDCDGDAVLYEVVQTGPACHTGTATCFTGRGISGADAHHR